MTFPIPISEPIRWSELMLQLNTRVNAHTITKVMVPVLADIFVFTYPVFLVVLYGVWIWKGYTRKLSWGMEEKLGALGIFGSAVFATGINIVIQTITEKNRPETYITNKEDLLLSHLPTDPFPSDHAAVSAAIAMATLIRAAKTKNKALYRMSGFFWLATATMSFSRVAVAVHRPTDVLVGTAVGVGCASLLIWSSLRKLYERYIAHPLISLEKYLLWRLRKRS